MSPGSSVAYLQSVQQQLPTHLQAISRPLKPFPTWGELQEGECMMEKLAESVNDMNQLQNQIDGVSMAIHTLKIEAYRTGYVKDTETFLKQTHATVSRYSEIKTDLLEKKKTLEFSIDMLRSLLSNRMRAAQLGSGLRYS